MKTKTGPWPTVKHYRPIARGFSFATITANAIAQREEREDEHFSGSRGPAALRTQSQGNARQHSPGFPPATCIAPTEHGVCGVSPAPFVDFELGGMVCAEHKPERGAS